MYRIVFQVACPGMVAGDKSSAVICQHCFGAGNTGQNALATAGKTGKKVRFDESFGCNKISPVYQVVQP